MKKLHPMVLIVIIVAGLFLLNNALAPAEDIGINAREAGATQMCHFEMKQYDYQTEQYTGNWIKITEPRYQTQNEINILTDKASSSDVLRLVCETQQTQQSSSFADFLKKLFGFK